MLAASTAAQREEAQHGPRLPAPDVPKPSPPALSTPPPAQRYTGILPQELHKRMVEWYVECGERIKWLAQARQVAEESLGEVRWLAGQAGLAVSCGWPRLAAHPPEQVAPATRCAHPTCLLPGPPLSPLDPSTSSTQAPA